MTDLIAPETSDLSREDKEYLCKLLEESSNRKKYNFIDTLFVDEDEAPILPGCLKSITRTNYPKHLEFFKAGATFTERAFIAGNRVGKSLAGLMEMYFHCSGKYPWWWEGKRFYRPIVGWLCGDRGEIIRDGLQKLWVGRTEFGTGIVPKDMFRDPKPTEPMTGIPGGLGQYFIKHYNDHGIFDGYSQVITKTYQSGKDAFESAEVDVIMLDEECPLDIYVECQMRTLTTSGITYLTFTPDSGLTDTVLHFMGKPQPGEPAKFIVMVGWDDVPHLPEEYKRKLLAAIPPHLRAVKTKGVPYLGSGAIYPILEEEFVVQPFKIPSYWPRAYAFDPGWNKTAALWGAYNETEDCWYLYSEYYRGQAEPEIHAASIKSRGEWMTGVADPHGSKNGRGVNSESFLQAYQRLGLELILAEPSGPGSVDIGINEVYSRLSTGRMKVFSNMQNWLFEYRIYRRDDKGRVVAEHNHLMDTTRYLALNGTSIMTVSPNELSFNKKKNYSRAADTRSSITGY
ncbi:MAG TPA: terminase family protein [Nitrososphaeraceae archaeon]